MKQHARKGERCSGGGVCVRHGCLPNHTEPGPLLCRSAPLSRHDGAPPHEAVCRQLTVSAKMHTGRQRASRDQLGAWLRTAELDPSGLCRAVRPQQRGPRCSHGVLRMHDTMETEGGDP